MNTNRTKHIVFDSDDDERSNKLQDKQPASQKNKLFEEDSESELDDSQEKADIEREQNEQLFFGTT